MKPRALLRLKQSMKKENKGSEDIDVKEFIALEDELQQTREKYGLERREGRLSRLISSFFEHSKNRDEKLISKKKYILLAIFTGWFGGHRFYSAHYRSAIFYLLLFWCGLPLAMTIVDLMIIIPMESDESGMLYL